MGSRLIKVTYTEIELPLITYLDCGDGFDIRLEENDSDVVHRASSIEDARQYLVSRGYIVWKEADY